jgi:hypothetical protein
MQPKCKDYPLLIFCGDVPSWVRVLDDEWKRR